MSIKNITILNLRLLREITGVCPVIILANRLEYKN